MWIKICGMTSAAAVAAALDAGADAIGFVFAPSVRRLTPEVARGMAEPARGRALCVAVTQHPAHGLIEEILTTFEPDLLQTDAEDLQAPRLAGLQLDGRCAVLPVLRVGQVLPNPMPPRLLFEGPISGSGQITDWSAAVSVAGRTQLVLAGGLRADNVAAAIRDVRPFGVDVSSGVESAPGVKSRALIMEFVNAARSAFEESKRT